MPDPATGLLCDKMRMSTRSCVTRCACPPAHQATGPWRTTWRACVCVWWGGQGHCVMQACVCACVCGRGGDGRHHTHFGTRLIQRVGDPPPRESTDRHVGGHAPQGATARPLQPNCAALPSSTNLRPAPPPCQILRRSSQPRSAQRLQSSPGHTRPGRLRHARAGGQGATARAKALQPNHRAWPIAACPGRRLIPRNTPPSYW